MSVRWRMGAIALAISLHLAGDCQSACAQSNQKQLLRRIGAQVGASKPGEKSSRRDNSVRPVVAQEPVPGPTATSGLDLHTLKSIALENSPSLYEASAHIDSLIGKRTQAGLWPNPEMGFSGQQVGSRGLAEQNGVYIGQKIITARKLQTDQSIISEEIRRAQFYYDAQRLRLETDVTIAYYETLAAQKLLEQAQKLTRIAEEGQKTTEALRRGSEASRIDVLQAQLEADSARILGDNAQHRLDSAWTNLATVVGQRGMAPQALAGTLKDGAIEFTWEEALATLMDRSPELRGAEATAERARWAHQRAMREVYPDINANGLVQRDNQIRGWDGAIQVTIPVPILNRNQGGIREALANIAVAEQAVQRTRLQLENRLAKVFESYINARKQVDRYETDLLPAADEQLTLVTRVFRAGEVGYVNLLVAQRSYSQVQVNAVDAQRQLAVSSARIEGLLLEGSLEDPGLAP